MGREVGFHSMELLRVEARLFGKERLPTKNASPRRTPPHRAAPSITTPPTAVPDDRCTFLQTPSPPKPLP
jgi:hypothetical protein